MRCFRCGGSGHRERDCTQPPRARRGPPITQYLVAAAHCLAFPVWLLSSFSLACCAVPSQPTDLPRRPCYLCGEGGHLVRDCPNDLCFRCNRRGAALSRAPRRVAFRPNAQATCVRVCSRALSRSALAQCCTGLATSGKTAQAISQLCALVPHTPPRPSHLLTAAELSLTSSHALPPSPPARRSASAAAPPATA